MKTLHALLATMMLLSSCRSVDKMIDQGDYDHAIVKTIRKISGKDNLSSKHIMALENAFEKAIKRDMSAIENGFESEKRSDLYQIIVRLRKIEKRQRLIEPLLPFTSKQGRVAEFSFIQTDELFRTAKEKYLSFTYRDAVNFLKEARNGDKIAARNAYHTFNDLWEFDDQYADARTMQKEAEQLGMNHINVKVKNATYSAIPDRLLNDLLTIGFKDDKWIRYYFDNNTQYMDQELEVILEDLEIGPEKILEKITIDEKTIEDGFKYVLDKNGNVEKDSLGNDIKIPQYRKIKARVIETKQLKKGYLTGYILNTNLITGMTQQVPFDSQIVFEHVYAKFRGDKRALSPDSKAYVGSAPLAFPSDNQMIMELVENLKPMLKNKIKQLNFNV